MRVIAIANHKGGSAKTTTTVNLAASLADAGKRVLVLDLDPQGNSSAWLGAGSGLAMFDLLTQDQVLAACVQESAIDHLSVVAASPKLASAEKLLAAELGAEGILARKLAAWPGKQWDYVLIDTPPALGILTVNALVAADEVLVPIEAHVMALAGVVQILETIALVNERLNPRLVLLGLLVCRFDARTRHGREVQERLVERFKDQVMTTVIRENIKLAEAPSFHEPIGKYDKRSTGAADYRALAEEVAAHRGKK